jgi:hypothetical protein
VISVKLTSEPLGWPVSIESTSSMMMLCSVSAFLLLNGSILVVDVSWSFSYENSVYDYRQPGMAGGLGLDSFDPILKHTQFSGGLGRMHEWLIASKMRIATPRIQRIVYRESQNVTTHPRRTCICGDKTSRASARALIPHMRGTIGEIEIRTQRSKRRSCS